MELKQLIQGFSKLSTHDKIKAVEANIPQMDNVEGMLKSFWHSDANIQKILSELSENTVSNFPLPYNVAPNFLINGKLYMVPMVTEESSVVAAASAAARFWAERGGFTAQTKGTQKSGQVHFRFHDNVSKLLQHKQSILEQLRSRTSSMVENMQKRGGGITSMEILDRSNEINHYYQLHVVFETADAMGANFINSVLEECSNAMGEYFDNNDDFIKGAFEPIMSILSNHVPGCTVEISVQCPVEKLDHVVSGVSGADFAKKFALAVEIATKDIYRAATHNKGIMNGVDAVIIATGNDFRAIEAGAHAYAASSGRYSSLSKATVSDGIFQFTLTMPMAVGTVGGLTKNHPLAALSLALLGNPSAGVLMQIAAAAGLANNFAAVKSLTTSGIQAGHMRMHLPNMLTQLGATTQEKEKALDFFKGQTVSHQKVSEFLKSIRN